MPALSSHLNLLCAPYELTSFFKRNKFSTDLLHLIQMPFSLSKLKFSFNSIPFAKFWTLSIVNFYFKTHKLHTRFPVNKFCMVFCALQLQTTFDISRILVWKPRDVIVPIDTYTEVIDYWLTRLNINRCNLCKGLS